MKSEYEKRMEVVASIKEQIAQQKVVVSKADAAAYDQMIITIDQCIEGDLQKLAGPNLLKSAHANARKETEALKKLQAECVQAQALANEEFPSYAAHLCSMQSHTPAAGGGRFFTVHKGGKQSSLEMPAAQPAVDLNRALFDSQMARKFQDREEP